MKIIYVLLLLHILFCTIGYCQEISINVLFGKDDIVNADQWVTKEEKTLRKEVYEAYENMRKAARRKFIKLKIVSAYRSFERQKAIWEYKWNSEERAHMSDKDRAVDILKYSAMPGTSRHHWGTDLDLNSVEPEFFDKKRKGRRIYKWLNANAYKFGFFQPYTDGRSKGYATEKWHWSYAPLSEKYLKYYLENISNGDISGFAGSYIADEIDVIKNWVDINEK